MDKKLSKDAYGGVAGKDYVPYITGKNNGGANIGILIVGIILAAVFAASTAYSGMKAGLTVAAGIPGAIVGGAIVGIIAKDKKILGSNIVQGMSSGGESVASGIIFVLPSLIVIGTTINFVEGIIVGIAGVLVGIGVASLVHNYLIVEEHGQLMYPEAMAISETIVASSTGGEALKFMGIGAAIGAALNFVAGTFMGWCNNVISFAGGASYKWQFSLEANPLLLGIGFIVGTEVALTMFAGSVIANFAVTPLIGYFSDMAHPENVIWNAPDMAINGMGAGDISGSYSKYIGAGMMLCSGIIGAVKLIPVIITSVKATLGATGGDDEGGIIGKLIIGVGIVLAFVGGFVISGGNITMAIVATIVSLILMLLFVIVAGRLTGTIGTSNLPVSGMTIASLVILTGVFLIFGWKTSNDNKILLMFGTLIVTAIAIAGGYMQSQKVTYIIGGKKSEMQKYFALAAIIGVIAVIGVISLVSGKIADGEFAIPQANLMATLTQGILEGQLPWGMIIAGVFFSIALHLLKLPVMTIAIGFYLPISTTSIILVGALIKAFVEFITKDQVEREARVSNGISLSSGLVAGGSIMGLIGIVFQVLEIVKIPEAGASITGNVPAFALLIILILAVTIPIITSKVKKN